MRIGTELVAAVTLLSLLACCVLTQRAYAAVQDSERLAMIDAHALAAPSAVEATPGSLVSYLSQPTQTDTEKARAIFRWVADRISYDVDAYFSNTLVAMDAEQVMRQRRSICDGYATLFEKLAHEAGLEAVTIKGYAKAYGHVSGTRFDKPNHTWNAVRIDGQWRLVDATWGAGYVKGNRYIKVLTESYFLAPPEQMMFSHFPLDERWQLQSTPHLGKREFEMMPDVGPAFFRLGILGEEAWSAMQAPDFGGAFVRTYDLPFHEAIIQHAPLSYRLHRGDPVELSIQSDRFEEMAIVQNDQWEMLNRNGEVFKLAMTPHDYGNLLVLGKKPGSAEYTAILGYQVSP